MLPWKSPPERKGVESPSHTAGFPRCWHIQLCHHECAASRKLPIWEIFDAGSDGPFHLDQKIQIKITAVNSGQLKNHVPAHIK